MNEHDDDDDELEGESEVTVYEVDEDTRLLVETACNCLVTLAEAQISEEAKENLITVADALAERFAISTMELEERHYQTEEGEEIILAPKGGSIFRDRDDDAEDKPEGEAPADKA